MQPTIVMWRDLTFATGQDAPYRLLAVDGWESTPPPRYDKVNRSRAHGAHPSPVWAEERVVTVEGRCWSQDDRDSLLRELKARMTFDGGEEPLTISLGGLTLTAAAQFLRCDPAVVAGEWGIGRFGWAAQWRCPDPLRYGAEQTAVTGLPTFGGGLSYPLSYPLNYGAAVNPGVVTLTNPGTAPAGILFTVTGPLPGGFQLSAGNDLITYPTAVPAGQVITVDTTTGHVLAEGTSDRRSDLSQADWMQIPPGGQLTVRFTSLGGYEADASLQATTRAAYW